MLVSICRVYFLIIIYKIFILCVVRRVDINHINTAPVCLFQQAQAMQIIAFKEKIIEIKVAC